MKLFQSSASENMYRVLIQGRNREFIDEFETDVEMDFLFVIVFYLKRGLEIVADSEEGFPDDGCPGTLFTVIFEKPGLLKRLWNRLTANRRMRQSSKFLRWELPAR